MHALKWFVLNSVGLACLCFSALEGKGEDPIKTKMIHDLQAIKHTLDVHYAPTEWKKSFSGWTAEQAFEEAKNEVLKKDKITTKQFQQIVRRFLGTTKDYHVQVYFFSTESAALPFEIKGVKDRYFISWIDTEVLSPTTYSISVGDELISFNGEPIKEVIAALKKEIGVFANPQTDQAIAELTLTNRSGMRGDRVLKGPVNVVLKSNKAGSTYAYQLMWDYQPECISAPADRSLLAGGLQGGIDPFTREKLKSDKTMFNPLYMLYTGDSYKKVGIGTYESFVPTLGKLIWMQEDIPFFRTYIYQDDKNRIIGYIRIPHYGIGPEQIKVFEELISVFQQHTDALVIDQLHNPGGYVIYQYILASMLTDKPLSTPQHRISLTQEEVIMALYRLSAIERIDNDEKALEFFPEDFCFRTYQYSLFLKEFYRFIIDEWNAGRFLTKPTYIEGVDYINPHPKSRYTKPILLLIDHLDFSCGDFFPAILQDNKRATLFGTRTSGAGGYVIGTSFPNSNGIAGFTYTGSIAERVSNRQPIENLGVAPDVEYQLTEEDLKTNYQPYVQAVNRALDQLLGN